MEIAFKGQLDRPTFFRAVRLANRGAGNTRMISYLALAAIAIAIYFSLQSFLSQSGADPSNLVRLGLALLLLVIILAFPYALAFIHTARIWKNPAMQTPISGRIDDSGITYTNIQPHRHVPWGRFARLRSDATLVALLTPDGVLTALPRSFFKNERDWSSLKKLLENKINQPKPRS